ncbi:hypothetical protein METBIDRAFT_38193 [Metschnikowia bicuspidata var. bicuspidata NRRL YB-4993]|uniref:DUF336-domain-containing protein n=1 Tax=Metschnikowia bicuspidata var. bicuspidata NRRL YB-4993 TaxID=869754 RepID=A0A1A0HIT2_9ASCO|nr:hypothetical protein METBIDRAFT_38193 [Metschnikowia bicuspidata var. bicuspidata NRRL YB-4993]OBA23920.1 hypothetical protein METBIDRAFT_38193 [Metschnikowia bicuspidata var. bicuspidata NRRL YB-4993]
MSNAFFSYSLEEIDHYESDKIALPHFDSSIAWQIGLYAHKLAQGYDKPMLIDISLSNGQVLFHAPSKNGIVLDNEHWVTRKKNTAFRFGKSSFYMGRKMAMKQMSAEKALFVDSKEYAFHGGSVPIKISGTDQICGALTVSGLAQIDDHLFVLQVLKDTRHSLIK